MNFKLNFNSIWSWNWLLQCATALWMQWKEMKEREEENKGQFLILNEKWQS